MRQTATATAIALLLLLTPASALLTPPALPAAVFDPDDATLLRLLSPGYTLRSEAELRALVAEPATLDILLSNIATHMGTTLTTDDIAVFDGLDPRVELPVRIMLAAIDEAWILRDEAFRDVPFETQLAHAAMIRDGIVPPAVSFDAAPLIDAGILILDTAENTAYPLLKQAVEAGAWPASAVADPVGILRLGGLGNDLETVHRVLQIDPRGDDVYRNNAGGTNFGQLLENPTGLRYQVGVSIDFDGNDRYEFVPFVEQHGAAQNGIGYLIDYSGDDYYRCGFLCQGSILSGVGVLRDLAGDDRYVSLGGQSTGYGSGGIIGMVRDDAGGDSYTCGAVCGGYAFLPHSIGLLWDRSGADSYYTNNFIGALGWGNDGGHGWLVDEGASLDYYNTATLPGPNAHGCDNCIWSAGDGGRGNDNAGGLAFLIASQNAFL